LGPSNDSVFLKECPDISKTPVTNLRYPENIDAANKYIDSNEERVPDVSKMRSLRALRDLGYCDRGDPFHWSLQDSFKAKSWSHAERCGRLDLLSCVEDAEVSDQDYDYHPHDVLAVRAGDTHSMFWVAEVISISGRNGGDVICMLKVRWYEAINGKNGTEPDPYTSKYYMSTMKIREKVVPFVQVISVNTVLVKV